ncbi:histidine triad (HIT) family protein [Daejeonella rubra]|uniref:Histidine triad (HIT) family protein n=1 Tax=Daejeonella rubra TaxID=990371 RepID=A0A1G9NTC4_9SPHI|nr:HIT family protein [Daejeonella rubra]SDL89277.1 histidine triad (HIT) family protein [Daejeonella rubra]
MESIFSKIVAGEIPAHKVAETLEYLAFLDINPLTEGHLLVIPKKEVDYLFDLDSETYVGLMMFAQIVAVGLKKAMPCERIGLTVMGLEVPHAHIHLIPMNTMDDMNFSRPKLNLTEERLTEIAEAIREQL